MDILMKDSAQELSQRKIETYERYCKVINWGRQDPVAFCHRFFGIDLLDYQKYCVYESWTKDFILWLQSRNAGKTTLLAIYPMLRSVLIPDHVTYFIGNTGEQAKEAFKKLEKIAKKEIESFTGSTEIFLGEVRRSNSGSDGFIHNPASFTVRLFNNSEINTLNSDIINIKGKRANLVCYDEAGWFNDELFIQTEQFVNQSEEFKLGGNIDISLEPKGFSRQLLYASSASDTSSEFYKKYKLFAKQMYMGDPKYFVCDFNVNLITNATFNGEPYTPLISQDKIDKAMSENREKAERELYNIFSSDSHEGQIVTRQDIMTNSKKRPPVLRNDGSRLFVAAYDSARMSDNSILGWAELIDDPEIGWRMEIQNVISMVDAGTKKKTPLRLPDQVKKLQDSIIDYNGSMNGKLDYENIKCILCDAGAGGQMIGGITDQLLDEWQGKDGRMHKGMIDRTHKANETAVRKYPNAADVIKLVDPKGNRNAIFEAAEQMTRLGVVGWPADAEGKDYILTINDDGSEDRYDLNFDEQLALVQIELMKDEIVTMCKYTSNGNITYNYPPELRNKKHDDRAFVYGLLCWYLAKLRRGQIINKHKPESSHMDMLFRRPKVR